MEAIRIDSGKDVSRPGEYSVFSRADKSRGIIYCCPQCGEVSAGTDKHRYNGETESLTPSIVHACGWHGWLRNGKFVKV